MSDMNQCTITGRLGADVEIRRTADGKPIANMRVACSDTWRDSNGERKEKTEWFNVVIFAEGLCKIAEAYLRKGSRVLLQGKVMTRKWTDQSGNDRYTTELVLQGYDAKLVMLDGKKDDEDRPAQSRVSQEKPQRSNPTRDSYGNDFDDAEIPF